MKKFGAIISLVAIYMQSTALAWVGGPYSNNTPDGFTGGIYRYTIRGKNANGIAKFSENSNSPFVSEFGTSVIYFKGTTFYGESWGSADFDDKSISGIFNGTAEGSDTDASSNLNIGDVNGVRNRGVAKHSLINGEWSGRFKQTQYSARFVGKGYATIVGSGVTDKETVIVNELNVAGTVGTIPSIAVDTTTTYRSSHPTQPDSRIRIRVKGSRVSVTPIQQFN